MNSGMGTCHQSLPGRVGQKPEIRAPVFPKHKLGTPPNSERHTGALWCWHWSAQDLTHAPYLTWF